MPEGPEVRREADRIARALVGGPISDVWFAFDHLRRWSGFLRGVPVLSVGSRGKAMLIRFANGVNIYSHNQLYGRWFVKSRGQLPKTNRQLRLAVHTEKHSALLYSASDIVVLSDDELESHSFLARLGPDVLSKDVGPSEIQARLQDSRFRRRSLGGLLLDQAFVSGLGNYLRSEILFVARLRPEDRPMDLGEVSRAELATVISEITLRSYRHHGVTNDLDDVRRLRAEGVARRDYRHYVFARGGKPCRLCGELVEKLESAGRRLYMCPVCQSVNGCKPS